MMDRGTCRECGGETPIDIQRVCQPCDERLHALALEAWMNHCAQVMSMVDRKA